MTFIHPALLAGSALAVLPVILHLILRQQPKRILFPAFRFLLNRATSNRRRMRLRHLLLLLMRILMVMLMCLALARPRVLNERLNLIGERAAAVVVIIDTSPSMGYTVAGKTRLEEGKTRALELIAGLPPNSRLAVLDVAESGGEWQPSASAARERVATRELKSAASPLADAIATGYRLFEDLARESGDEEPPPRFLYVFTDRTPACWDAPRTRDLIAARDRLAGPAINHVMIDLGIEKPADVALLDVRLSPQVIPANKPVVIPVTIQATGQDVETQVQCRINGLPEVESKPVQLVAGQAKEVSFRRSGLKPGFYQAEISLATTDALAADNVRYISFEVRTPRPVLIICDQPEDAKALVLALKANYPCDVISTSDPKLRALAPQDLAKYRAIALLSVAAPGRADLWEKLESYVAAGGGLAVFPDGEEVIRDDYNRRDGPAGRLMPGSLKQYMTNGDQGVPWIELQYQHPLMGPFRDDAMNPETGFAENPPRAYRYWEVEADPTAHVLVRYGDDAKRPALLETGLDRKKHRGKVLLFTTPFDNRRDVRDRPANDYSQWWFYLALTNRAIRYLGGTIEDAEYNDPVGRTVTVPLPAEVRAPAFNLVGPGLSGSDSLVTRPEKAFELRLTQPREAGNYMLSTPDRSWLTGFSLNSPAEEFQLLPRVPVETIAELFGPDSVLAPGQNVSLKDKLDQHFQQPVELFPWLMLLLLILFVVENYLANRFYRRDDIEVAALP